MSSEKDLTSTTNLNPTLKDGRKFYWQKWYIAVIGFLVVQVILYYLITIYFQ